MKKEKFLELQYLTLRKEIEETKGRIFKIIVGGASVVPAAQFLAQTYDVGVIMLLLPFLVIIIILLFLAENNALMRCGRYIRLHIEPYIRLPIEPTIPEGIMGWETWEEETSEKKKTSEFDPRAADRYLIYSFYLLATLYYIVSVYLAASFTYTNTTYSLIGLTVVLGTYIALGIWVAILVIPKVRATTR